MYTIQINIHSYITMVWEINDRIRNGFCNPFDFVLKQDTLHKSDISNIYPFSNDSCITVGT